MASIKFLAVVLIVAALAAGGLPTHGNAANPPEKTDPAEPAKHALVTLENSAYQAWKSKDAKFWDTFLADKFVGYGSSGRLDKASAKKEYTDATCDIRHYALSDVEIRLFDPAAALITYKATVDGICGGQKVPAITSAATVYVRDGDQWKGAFHAQSPVVDPAAAAAQQVANNQEPKANEIQPAARDAGTEAMLARERTVWEAWKRHDGKTLAEITAKDLSFINIFGTYFATKADALKDWTGTACDAKRVSVTGAQRTMLSPTTTILTFTGNADGTCSGQVFNSVIWGTSVYVKEGDTWKWTFGINTPALRKAD